ncbi:hypothetical protein CMI37_31010 [Candidatus Pacearchaeota archaeon]|nr:hypothetical protein [Candidatus Pacearchaeota archaeon]|tara:strand:+ start:659 stop:2611 length:1953 start_codon:yes stop_codon:yes gene_type:complete
MPITTFAGLIATPDSQKDFLVIVTPKKQLFNWAKTGGRTNVYEVSWANIFEASSGFGNTYRLTSSVEHNGTALDTLGSTAAVDASAGSYWHDTSNDLLYIHTTNSSNPNSVANYIVVFFNLFISSGMGKAGQGKIFSDIYYEPLLSADNIPSFIYEQTDLLAGGGMKTGTARFELKNPYGFWDIMIDDFSWKNADWKLYFGGESLPFTEYALVYMGSIRQEEWNENKVYYDTVNYIDLLKRIAPITALSGADVAPGDRGKPIPFAFGVQTAIKPLLSDNSTADAYEYTIADANYQTLKSIDAVYDGGSAVGSGDLSLDLANCKFTFVTYTPTGEVTCDVKGAKISDITDETSTDLMASGSDVIKFFLRTVLGLPAAKLDSASFASAKADNTFALNKYMRYRRNISSYIAEIEKSVMGNLYVNNNGKFQLDIYTPTNVEDDNLIDEEMDGFVVKAPIDKIFEGIKVHYNPTPYERDETSPLSSGEEDTYKEVEGTNNRAKYVDKQDAAYKNIYTWITSETDANVLKGRLLTLTNAPIKQIEITVKGIKLFQRKPGDVLKISRATAPTSTGTMLDEGYQIIRISKDFSFSRARILVDNFAGLGLFIGMWTLDAAPAWATASDTEKAQSGFWCDDNGFCLTADTSSLNKSLWW